MTTKTSGVTKTERKLRPEGKVFRIVEVLLANPSISYDQAKKKLAKRGIRTLSKSTFGVKRSDVAMVMRVAAQKGLLRTTRH